MGPSEYWDRELDRIGEHHKKMYAEFGRLVSDIPYKTVSVGDICVVAIGLLNRGHLWIRQECKVTGVGDMSVKVRSYKKHDEWEEWIHPALIVDVIKKENKK